MSNDSNNNDDIKIAGNSSGTSMVLFQARRGCRLEPGYEGVFSRLVYNQGPDIVGF